MYETVEMTTGFCPKCGKAYGYVKDSISGMLVNEFSKCVCKNNKCAYEKEVYTEQRNAISEYVKRTREEVA